MTTPKIIYIAGRYRGDCEFIVHSNVAKAELAAVRLWREGWAVICPHKNSEHFGGIIPDEDFIKGDIEILKHCQAIYMLNNWKQSQGACQELEAAQKAGLEIIYQKEQ